MGVRETAVRGARPASLAGAAFTAYRLVWLALFAAAVVSVLYLSPIAERARIRMIGAGFAIGVQLYSNSSLEGMLGSPLDDAARRDGLVDNDLIYAVDGRPVPATVRGRTAVLEGPPGSTVALSIRHPDGTRQAIRVARDPARIDRAYAGWHITFAGRRWTAFAVRTIAALAALAAAALLFVRRPRDPVAQLIAFALAFGYVDMAGIFPAAVDPLNGLQDIAAQPMLMLAVLAFPDRRLPTRWHWLALATIVANAGWQTWMFFRSEVSVQQIFGWFAVPALVLVAVWQRLRLTAPGVARQQTKFALFGICVYCLLAMLAALLLQGQFLPLAPGAHAWIVLGTHLAQSLGDIAIPAGLLVSLLRFRLYDAETAISRSVAYGALTVALVAVFAGSEQVIEILGAQYLGEGLGPLAGGLGAAVAAGTVAPLHTRVTRWAERRFQGNLIHLRRGLPLLVGDLRETASPAVLADAMLVRVERGVRAVHGAVVAGDRILTVRDVDAGAVRGWLAGDAALDGDAAATRAAGGSRRDLRAALGVARGDALFPLRVPLYADGVGLSGWLLLGPRPDGSFYGRDERETLAEIADPLARALAIACERELREHAQAGEIGGLRQRLAAVEAWLGRLAGPPAPATAAAAEAAS